MILYFNCFTGHKILSMKHHLSNDFSLNASDFSIRIHLEVMLKNFFSIFNILMINFLSIKNIKNASYNYYQMVLSAFNL